MRFPKITPEETLKEIREHISREISEKNTQGVIPAHTFNGNPKGTPEKKNPGETSAKAPEVISKGMRNVKSIFTYWQKEPYNQSTVN